MSTVAGGGGGSIVVGVDESVGARYAVRWAAGAARLHHRNLIIVHVAPHDTTPPPSDVIATREHLLNASAAAASQREPSVVVGTLLLHGLVSEKLVELSDEARLLVVGVNPSRPRSSHGVLGSVEDRVIVHAGCPVVTVPHQPRLLRSDPPLVVAVWTPDATSGPVLALAAAEATPQSRGVSVIAESRPAEGLEQGSGRYRRLLETQLRDLAALHPGLRVEVTWVSEDLAGAVKRASVDADLIVMGCESAEDRWSIRAGFLAEVTMRRSACPVMFINEKGAGWLARNVRSRSAMHRDEPPRSADMSQTS